MAAMHGIVEGQTDSDSINQAMEDAINLTTDHGDSGIDFVGGQIDLVDSVTGKVYECSQCTSTFTEIPAFEIHKLKHSLENPFRCGVCDASFPKPQALTHHINIHMALLGKKTENPTPKRKSNSKRKSKPRKCAPYKKHRDDAKESTPELSTGEVSEEVAAAVQEEATDKVQTATDVTKMGKREKRTIVCLVCPREFISQYHMKQHMKSHTQLEKLGTEHHRAVQCPECDRTFSSDYHMNMHLKTHSQSKKKKGRRISKKSDSTIANTKCGICQKICISEYHLKLHFQKHRDKKTQRVACNICFHTYSTNQALRTHLLSHTNIRPFQCAVCGKAFHLRAVLERHQAVHAEKSSFKCDHCPSAFKSADRLQRHSRRSHIETMPESTNRSNFFCDVCKEYFTDRSHAKIHQDTTVRFICEMCGSSFKKRQYLSDHVRLQHNTKTFKREQCSECNQTFRNAAALKSHSTIHTGEKPFQCHMCGAHFRLKSLLVNHEITHRDTKPYSCNVCAKGFNSLKLVQRHSIVHVPNRPPNPRNFVCHCGKGFTTQRYLRDHKITHTGNRSYVCVVCGTKCKQVAALLRHIKTHTINATNVQCRLCLAEFKELTELQMHMVIHDNPQNESLDFNSENGFAILNMNTVEDFEATNSVTELPTFFINSGETSTVYACLSEDSTNMCASDPSSQ